MRLFFLFFTQAEGGAPGYLSRKGEDAAQNLAESLFQFLSESLAVDVMGSHAMRVQSLTEDLRWRAYRKQESLGQAVMASLHLCPELLLICGSDARTLKTTEKVAELFALPVCVDERLDKHPDPQGRPPKGQTTPGYLADSLEDLVSHTLPAAVAAKKGNAECLSEGAMPHPLAIIIGTSHQALMAWLNGKMDPTKLGQLREALSQASEGDILPVVFACGFESSEGGQKTWIFD